MIQKKKKQVKIVVLITLVIAILGVGIWGIATTLNSNNKDNNIVEEDLSQFELKSLIVTTNLTEKELKEEYKAIEANSLTFGASEIETYELKYSTEKDTKDAYEKLKADENVKNVNINTERTVNKIPDSVFYYKFQSDGEAISNWGPIAMGLDEALEIVNDKTDNQEIIVAIIDSGFDSDHSFIVNSKTLKDRIKEGFNAIEDNTDITDNNGHGTNVGSIILEATPNNVKILPIKALDKNEDGDTVGTDASTIKAINYAVKNGADIINMSIGGEETTIIAAEQEAINNANSKNVICIAAAGNGDDKGKAIDLDTQGINFYPAECENVITVGAVENKLLVKNVSTTDDLIDNYLAYKDATANDMEITTFSNYGSSIDFAAPGHAIMGLFPETSEANIKWLSGTSQAAPHISAAAAIVKTYNKDYTREQIEEILTYYAQDLGEEGKDDYYGNGFVSFKNFKECDCNTEKCDGIYCFGCEDTKCIYHLGSTNRLSSIEITTAPMKTEYNIGENFDRAGMIVTAHYSDGTEKVVTDYTCNPMEITEGIFTINTAEGNMAEITISYTENEITETAIQKIKQVNNALAEAPELVSIEITTPPTKTTYNIGERFDKSGMVVTANYNDGSKKIVTDYTCDPMEIEADIFIKDGTEVNSAEITISYTENGIIKTAIQKISKGKNEVDTTELTDIKIVTPPAKTTYKVGERFDKSGMVVTAYYNDGTEKLIDGYTIEPDRELEAGDLKVVITYTENGITKTTEQAITIKAETTVGTPGTSEKVLSGISAPTKPTKTDYAVGEKFDPSGMVIVATYSDGTSKKITDYTYTPKEALKTTDKQVTISYEEDGVTKSIDIPITVQSATTQNEPPGLGSNMMEVINTNPTEGQGSTQTTVKTEKGDTTTSGGKLANTGIEDTLIPIAICIIGAVMVASYISYRRYRDI